MKKFLMLSTVAALAFGQMAHADEAVDPATKDKLAAQLVAEGYDVRKIEMEDGQIEAYALKDGKKYELYFDADLVLIKSKLAGS